MIENVLEFTQIKHEGQKREGGKPYYLHPVSVAKRLKEKGFSEIYQMVGLCHDLLEDTDILVEELEKITNKEIAYVVQLLTKQKDFEMKKYIQGIKENDIAKIVKLADRIDNLTDIVKLDHKILKYYKFKMRYIGETITWYIDLAKGTIFEKEMNDRLQELIQNVKE